LTAATVLHRGYGLGRFSVDIEIGDPDGNRFEPVRTPVDTVASYTTIPSSVLQERTVTPHERVTFVLADGRRIERDVGRTWVRIEGKSEITLVVFGDEESEALLGAYSLQELLLGVNTPNERRVSVPGLMM